MPHDPSGPTSFHSTPSSREAPSSHDLTGALHEVSNALTVVVGWLDRALLGPLDPEQTRALTVARARALDGRDIARRAIGALPQTPVQQPLTTLLDEALLGVLPEASSAAVHVHLRPLTGPPALVDDARILLQILTNLLLNAVAFSPMGGQVEVTAGVEADEAWIIVADEGPGIPEEHRHQLFQRGNSKRQGGAGIGLAHAYELASSHGGKLSLLDTPRGTSFQIRWPCAPTRSSASPTPRPSITLRGRRVLLLEDDRSILDLLEIALSSRGVATVLLPDITALHAALKQGPFDAVLVDWSPIAASPLHYLTTLRVACPSVPLLVISGSATIPDAEALALCAVWIRKPFDLGELLATLTSVLPTKA
ncbi:MAG: ATP-binding protein [Myxococcales bacterium]|nr:ATP-binding protein [Polyangiaceae bacterium]MDW8249171.1 ATP-binding protein [Myxococcales bacterium]